MGKIDIDEMYAGISNAETGGEKNAYVRTKSKPKNDISTAYGPVQVTGRLAAGSKKAGYLSKESQDFYDNEMAPRYAKMKEGKDKRYDYGGDAEMSEDEHGEGYTRFAKDIMSGVANEAKHDEKQFIKKWRGRSQEQDPEYYKRVEEGRKKYRDNKFAEDVGGGIKKMFAAMKGTDS